MTSHSRTAAIIIGDGVSPGNEGRGYVLRRVIRRGVYFGRQIGVDLTGHRCKTFGELEDESFDLVISLTPEAQHRAVELARGRSAAIEYWPTLDPTLTEGSREHRLESYRQVRDGLAERIRQRFLR